MKKLLLSLVLALALSVLCIFSVSAADNVVYVADGGTGDGTSDSAPFGTITEAYTALGDESGTIVISGKYTVGNTTAIQMPSHTGTVTITSVYGDVDYRESGATLSFNGTSFAAFNGPTVFDGLTMNIEKTAAGICMNFNDLYIGYDVDIINSDETTTERMYIVGGPNSNAAIDALGDGETNTIEIYSGTYLNVCGFSRATANKSHTGTVTMKIGGDAHVKQLWLGAVGSASAIGGTTVLDLTDNVTVTSLYLSADKSGMNGSATVNIKDNAAVNTFLRYDKTLFPNGTRTLNIYSDTATLPSGYEDCFDTVNTFTESPEVPEEPENLDVVFFASSGNGDGKSADSPIGSIADAYELLGDDGGTLVFVGDGIITATVDFPAHTGTVTLTSLYDGVDYRESGAALHYDAAITVRLNGPTVIDNFNIEIDTTGAVITANFHDLTIGYNTDIIKVDGGTGYYMYVIGGQNNASDSSVLGNGEIVNITINSGKYICVTGFSRLRTSVTHTGTANINIGGSADVRDLYMGCLSSEAVGGSAVLALDESASVQNLYLSGGSAGMSGSSTVNISDSASVGAFKNYAKDTYFPNGTRTLNATGTPTLPANYTECFDTLNVDIEVVECDTVYLSGSGTGDGLTPDTPVNTLAEAYNKLTNGGTIVVVGELTVERTTAPAHENAVTITSVYDGVDYRKTGAKIVFPASSVTCILGGETVFKDITIDMTAAGVISAAFNPLTFDTGVVINADYNTSTSNGLYVTGGDSLGTYTEGAVYDKNPSITVRSGDISRLIAFSRYSGARAHTGTATVTVENDAIVRYLFTGSSGNQSSANKAVINLKDEVIIENLVIGGADSTNPMTGETVINVDEMNGGIIQEIDVMSLYNNKGGVTLNYDKSTLPDGLLFLANLALFENIQTVCERDGSHSFGTAEVNPFDETMQIRICSACGHTEIVGDAPSVTYKNVAFVADGGFGNGSHPALPLGSFEDAMKKVAEEGGTVVLVGETTLQTNWAYKLGSDPAFFQEPTHESRILITSVYNDVDYRENGAKLVFNGNMHYKLSGDTTFDNIVFDATASATSNIIAARYNALVFGNDVKMLRTTEDGYSLGIVGGYQYFRYTDFVDVYIEDEYLRFSNHAVGVDTFELPDSKTIDIDVATGDTAPAYLRKEAAEAFDAMFIAMEAEGLELPTITSGMQTYEFKYDYITRFFARTWRSHPDWNWDQVFTYVTKSTGLPGYSEHHLGLAVDMYDVTPDFETDSPNHDYDLTKEWAWIEEHGKEYGIILRYPDNGTSTATGFITEAWHFRYVGVDHATDIMDNSTYKLLEYYVGEYIGMFDKDSNVIVNSGSYDFIMGGSNGCDIDDITFTGTNNVRIGANVDYETATDVVSMAGDATGDGEVTLIDIVRLLKYCADNTVEINATNADINGDSVVDIKDAMLVIKAVIN